MLQAMNNGTKGSMTTIHANSARDALTRLEVTRLDGGAGTFPTAPCDKQISSAMHIGDSGAADKAVAAKDHLGLEITGMKAIQSRFARPVHASSRAALTKRPGRRAGSSPPASARACSRGLSSWNEAAAEWFARRVIQ